MSLWITFENDEARYNVTSENSWSALCPTLTELQENSTAYDFLSSEASQHRPTPPTSDKYLHW